MSEEDRAKIRGRPRPQKPPIKPLQPGYPVVQAVWARDERLLGRFVIEWSRLEAAAQALIWAFLKLESSDGKIVTARMDVGALLQMLRTLATRNLVMELLEGFLTHINAAEEIKDARNLAVHGLWHLMGPEKTPAVMSIRPKIEDGKAFGVSETFPVGRLSQLIRATEALRLTFAALEIELLASPETLLIQHPKG